MKNFVKTSKLWMLTLLCVLFFGIGIKAEAAPGAVNGLQQTKHGYSAVEIKWNNVSGDFDHYKVEIADNTSFTSAASSEAKIPTAQISGLSAGKSYYVRVTAIDKTGTAGTVSQAIEVVTAPMKQVQNLKQTAVADKKISFSWNAVDGANAYDIDYAKANTETKTITTTKTSHTISASADSKYAIRVWPFRKSSTGYMAYPEESLTATKLMSTTPKKVTKLKLYSSGSNTNAKAGIVTFSLKPSNAADGYEYEIYGYNGKKIVKKSIKESSLSDKGDNVLMRVSNGKLKNTQFMKIRVRGYIENVNGKKKVGKWSDYLWFSKSVIPKKTKLVSNNAADGFTISWTPIKGAKNYSVYVSRSSQGKYKKVGTTSGSSYTVKSLKGAPITSGNYYYYVVANKKVGKKTYKSDDSWYNGFSITTTYTYY